MPGTPIIYYGTDVVPEPASNDDGVFSKTRRPSCRCLWGGDHTRNMLAHFQELTDARRSSRTGRRGDRKPARG